MSEPHRMIAQCPAPPPKQTFCQYWQKALEKKKLKFSRSALLERVPYILWMIVDRCRFFDLLDRPFSEGLLPPSVLLSLEDLLQLLGLFLSGCSFRGSSTLGETSLLLRSWLLFDLTREGLLSRSLELLSLPDIMLDLSFKTEQAFTCWLGLTETLWWQR